MDFYSNNYDLLTNSERSLLHYILDHPQTIQKMTCRKLADQCGVSKTCLLYTSCSGIDERRGIHIRELQISLNSESRQPTAFF